MKRFVSAPGSMAGVQPPPGRPPLGRRRDGIILVLTLWLVIVLSLVAYSLAYEMQMEMRLTTMRRDGLAASELARLGIARAVADLKNDLIMDYHPDEKNPGGQPFDGPGDIWRLTKDKTDVPAGESGTYSVRVTDEESRLALNRLAPRQPDILKHLIILLGEHEKQAEEIAQAIYDWMDPDDRPVGGKGESEVEFYSEQIARAQRIRWDKDMVLVRPKNDVFVTLDELLLVPGVTPKLYYGYDPSDEKDAAEREERLAKGKEVPLGLRDCLSLYSRGELNINTAAHESLAALFSAMRNNSSEGQKQADDVLRSLGRTGRGEVDNDKAVRSPQEIATALGAEGALLVSAARGFHPIGVRSYTFLIEATGQLLDSQGKPKMTRTASVLVSRDWQSFPIDEKFGDRRERRSDYKAFLERLDKSRRKEMEKIGSAQVPNVRALWWREN